VRAIVELWRQGLAPETNLNRMPHLTLAQVFDALSYFSDQQGEIQQWIERNRIPDDLIDPLVSGLWAGSLSTSNPQMEQAGAPLLDMDISTAAKGGCVGTMKGSCNPRRRNGQKPLSNVTNWHADARAKAARNASFQTLGVKVSPCVYPRQIASTPMGSSAKETRGSSINASYILHACDKFTACSRNTLGFVASRKKPCWVIRQKKQIPSGTPSNQFFAATWCTWEAKARASQTLMSGSRNIIVIQNFRDAIGG
jgi:hypothetical protein